MNEVMRMAMQAGRILLENGAETYRVEETMVRICESYGCEEAHSFVLPTGLFLSVVHNKQTQTMVIRVKKRAVDLNKIDLINEMSRNAVEGILPLVDFESRLSQVEHSDRYSSFILLFFAGICGAAFAIFYQGSVRDACAAFIATTLVKWATMKMNQLGIYYFVSDAAGGALTTFFAILLKKIGLGADINIIIAATLMILVPGVAITNAIRDSIAGDLVSGIAKGVEAVLIAVAIALGTGAVLSLYLLLGGVL